MCWTSRSGAFVSTRYTEQHTHMKHTAVESYMCGDLYLYARFSCEVPKLWQSCCCVFPWGAITSAGELFVAWIGSVVFARISARYHYVTHNNTHIKNAVYSHRMCVLNVRKSGASVSHFALCRVFRNMFQSICSGVLQECSITNAGEHFLLSGINV